MNSVILCLFLIGSSFTVEAQSPDFVWAKNATGSNAESGDGICVDASGNVYVAGHFFSTTISFGTFTLNNNGNNDLFLVKYDALGNVLWAKGGGGIFFDIATDVTTDAAGNVYVTGNFYSPTVTIGTSTFASNGGSDAFLIKLDGSGNEIWSKKIGGDFDDLVKGISSDPSGNIYVTGQFQSTSLISDSYTLSNTGSSDIFALKIDNSGTTSWAKNFEGSGSEVGNGIHTDAGQNVYLTGEFSSTELTIGTFTLYNQGSSDVFITKLDASGNALWARSIGGTFNDMGTEITSDLQGNVIIGGDFISSSIVIDTYTLSSAGNFDLFLAKFNSVGNTVWALNIGDVMDEVCTGITTDFVGSIYLTGHFHSPSAVIGTNTFVNSGMGGDLFFAKYNSSGNTIWSRSIGGINDDGSSCITSDQFANIYISGFFASPSITCSSYTLSNTGNADMFVGKIQSTITGMESGEANILAMANVYPNPSNRLYCLEGINGSEVKFEIHNLDGIEVPFIGWKMNDQTYFDLGLLPKGIYYLTIAGNNSKVIKKLILI